MNRLLESFSKIKGFISKGSNTPIIIIGICALAFFVDGNACLYKRVFGIPCPGCGMTRAYISLIHFDIRAAFYYHPLFLLPVFIALIFLFQRNKYISRIYKSNFVWVTLSVIIIFTWALRMFSLFPNHAPMDLNKNAVVIKIFLFFFK